MKADCWNFIGGVTHCSADFRWGGAAIEDVTLSPSRGSTSFCVLIGAEGPDGCSVCIEKRYYSSQFALSRDFQTS